MQIRDEAGAIHDGERLGIWRVMPSASPLRAQGRALRPTTPTGWLVVANRLGTEGASLVCLASCAHRQDARQLLDALLLARRRGAPSFDFARLRWTRPCPMLPVRRWTPMVAPSKLGAPSHAKNP